jgi:glycosyltransferase involved in cell wall biosynthesis
VPAHAEIILANGLITAQKRLDRMVAALPRVLKRHPDVYFLVLGREHPTQQQRSAGKENAENAAPALMPGLLALAAARGVRGHVLWLDGFVEQAELAAMLARAAVFVTPFDESTPTSVCFAFHLVFSGKGSMRDCLHAQRCEDCPSRCLARACGEQQCMLHAQGTLLMAMAHGLPVVSTPYHFALELLQNGSGLLVPFADRGPRLARALCRLLEDAALRSAMVRR